MTSSAWRARRRSRSARSFSAFVRPSSTIAPSMSGSTVSSISAARAKDSPGRSVTRPGTASHARRNSETAGIERRVRASPGRPPETPDRPAARSGSTPMATSPSDSSDSSTLPKCTLRHRLATVVGRSSSDSATRRNTEVGVGSSRVLRRALAACSVIDPASSRRKTFRVDSTGVITACWIVDRACSTPSRCRPSGSTRTRSGWVPAAASRHDRQGMSCSPATGHRRRAAKRRATVALPMPVAPTNR